MLAVPSSKDGVEWSGFYTPLKYQGSISFVRIVGRLEPYEG